jgi:hypothetical protein
MILWDPGFVEGLVHAPFWSCCRNIGVHDITFRTFMFCLAFVGSERATSTLLSLFGVDGVESYMHESVTKRKVDISPEYARMYPGCRVEYGAAV